MRLGLRQLLSVCIGLLVAAQLTSCTYTAAVSQTNFPANRGREVQARVYKFIFLGFNFDNDEIFKLTSDLQAKCPNGDVRGILTKDMRTLYLLTIFWARETIAKGYCVPSQRVASVEGSDLRADAGEEAAIPPAAAEAGDARAEENEEQP